MFSLLNILEILFYTYCFFLKVNYHLQLSRLRLPWIVCKKIMKIPSKHVSTVVCLYYNCNNTWLKAKFQRHFCNPTCIVNLNSWDNLIMHEQSESISAFTIMAVLAHERTQTVNWTYLLWNNQENVSMTFGNYFHI